MARINLERLEADIAAGVRPPGSVKIVRNEEVLAAIQEGLAAHIRQKMPAAVAGKTAAQTWSMAKSGELQFSKKLADTLQKFHKADDNARNAKAVLIQGVVPANHIETFP